MVVPLNGEEDWLPLLAGKAEFIPGRAPVLVVAPHPDDETLGTGGLITMLRQRDQHVKLVAVTNGEHAYEDNDGLATRRIQEQVDACACLGLDSSNIVRLGISDSAVSAAFKNLVAALAPHITKDTHVFAPWPHDFHPDHEACGLASQLLAREAGAALTFYFFWTWHRGTPALLMDLPLTLLPLTPEQQSCKADALSMHASQLDHSSGDPILHKEHLWPARLPFEVYLPA